MGLKHHEFWPWWILIAPVWPLWIYYMVRSRRMTWFTAVNPGMEDSGFLGESKFRILNSIPDKYLPKTQFIQYSKAFESLSYSLVFPFIAKPDIGGRGRKINIIRNQADFEGYHLSVGEDYMIQEIIPYELEFGIFYIRMPWQTQGEIVSVSKKEFLQVVGDGRSSIEELMKKEYRSAQQIKRIRQSMNLNEILPVDEKRLLEPIGNHCRGTIFRDYGHIITPELTAIFDKICSEIDGFYYGRFDLRVQSMEDLFQGQFIRIMELNGLTSDPAHIFDPNSRLRDAFKVQWSNCRKSYRIASYFLKRGGKTTPVLELIQKSMKGFKS